MLLKCLKRNETCQIIFIDAYRKKYSSPRLLCRQQCSSAHVFNDTGKPKPFADIPGPKGLPFFGTWYQYKYGPFSVKKYHEAILERYKEYGSIYKETILGRTTVHLLHPDLIKQMYAHEGKIPHIPPLLETTQLYRKQKGMSPGLGNTNGGEWYRLRTNINQMMMRPKAVTMFLPHVNEVADDFITYIKLNQDSSTSEVPEFSNAVSLWILESSAKTCFERRLNCFQAENDSFVQKMINASNNIFTLSLKLNFSIPWFKIYHFLSYNWKELVAAEDFFFGNGQKFVDEAVKKIEDLDKEGKLDKDQYGFLTYLLGKPDLSYKDLSIITLSLFADGLSTTVPTTIGQLYCLASNEENQEKLYREICKLTSETDNISAEMISEASYLKACVKEGFRFFPIGTEVSRIPQTDLTIGDYHIPAGTHVELNNNMLLRLPEYFEDPDSYMPERWIRGGSAQNIHPYLLLPFGYGPRTCAGRRFAEQEMYVLIMKLVKNFKLQWNSKEEMQQNYNMLLKPDKPCHISFIPRT